MSELPTRATKRPIEDQLEIAALRRDFRTLRVEAAASVEELQRRVTSLTTQILLSPKARGEADQRKRVEGSIAMLADRVERLSLRMDAFEAKLSTIIEKRPENRVVHLYDEPTETGKNAGKGSTPKARGGSRGGGGSNADGSWDNAVRALEG